MQSSKARGVDKGNEDRHAGTPKIGGDAGKAEYRQTSCLMSRRQQPCNSPVILSVTIGALMTTLPDPRSTGLAILDYPADRWIFLCAGFRIVGENVHSSSDLLTTFGVIFTDRHRLLTALMDGATNAGGLQHLHSPLSNHTHQHTSEVFPYLTRPPTDALILPFTEPEHLSFSDVAALVPGGLACTSGPR